MIPDIDRQIEAMRLRWPAWRVLERGADRALWHGRFEPTTVTYDVNMYYRAPHALESGTTSSVQPRVTVQGLNLSSLHELVESPHIYVHPSRNRPPELCLFDPAARSVEWSAGDLLADTTVHWVGQWLIFYEGWLATGQWYGGGRHPGAERAA